MVAEQTVVAAIKSATSQTTSIRIQLPKNQTAHGLVLVQLITDEGLVLLEARAHAPEPGGITRLDLLPIEPGVRAWLEQEE
jgi:hypothetical protein